MGGYVRDLVLRKIHSHHEFPHISTRTVDLDFAVNGDPKELARQTKSRLGGTLVNLGGLGKKEGITRLVLKNGNTLDFSRLRGSLKADLKARDFTINAMAFSPAIGLVDPFAGARDIAGKTIRKTLKRNFRDDPLRMLRAYRFQSELGFNIEKETQRTIMSTAARIRHPASERITLELIRTACGKSALKAFKAALSDGLLGYIVSLSYNDLRRNINRMYKVEQDFEKIPKRIYFNKYPQGLSYAGLLRLQCLLTGSSGDLLSLSTATRKRIKTAGILVSTFNRLSDKSKAEGLYPLFLAAGDSLLDLLFLTQKHGLLEEASRFMKIQARGLLSAEEIMEITGMCEGPALGRTIEKLRRLQFERVIQTKANAIHMLEEATT